MISLRDASGEIVDHQDIVTCDVVTSVVNDDLIVATSDETFADSNGTLAAPNDGFCANEVIGDGVISHGNHDIHGSGTLALAEEQIIETSEDQMDNLFPTGYSVSDMQVREENGGQRCLVGVAWQQSYAAPEVRQMWTATEVEIGKERKILGEERITAI